MASRDPEGKTNTSPGKMSHTHAVKALRTQFTYGLYRRQTDMSPSRHEWRDIMSALVDLFLTLNLDLSAALEIFLGPLS
ncbi:hypothetical protein GCM10028784_18620 [Myceligenerans cantabricum]